MSISAINSTILFKNVRFHRNQISYQMMDIRNSKNVEFDNVTCNFLNFNKKTQKGGCFRFNNILIKNLRNVEISNSYSFSTTVGIKFIDNTNTMEYLSEKFNFNSSKQVNLISFK